MILKEIILWSCVDHFTCFDDVNAATPQTGDRQSIRNAYMHPFGPLLGGRSCRVLTEWPSPSSPSSTIHIIANTSSLSPANRDGYDVAACPPPPRCHQIVNKRNRIHWIYAVALATIPMASLMILCTIFVTRLRQTRLGNGRQCCLIPVHRPRINGIRQGR